jgi:hypothetical protein
LAPAPHSVNFMRLIGGALLLAGAILIQRN